MAVDIWPTIHAERKALVADLEGISDDQWQTPSLCEGWNVHQMLGHMLAAAKKSPLGFITSLAAAGFRFNTMTANDVAKESAGSPAQTLAAFEAEADSSVHPPGPNDTWLGETIIHGEDIRRPLGINHTYPADAVKRVLDFYKGSNLVVGAKKRIGGLTLAASDSDWTTGSGPEVRGPGVSLMLAMTGRRAALDDLTGDGVATLSSRM
ncbi:MAG: hypothetical protein QOG03_653 [Actinomycetota bacterium]|jgi:uncharacterized protein (TIGR03083 family)|nr:hypothetical protein [Actinomycetota bacterium]